LRRHRPCASSPSRNTSPTWHCRARMPWPRFAVTRGSPTSSNDWRTSGEEGCATWTRPRSTSRSSPTPCLARSASWEQEQSNARQRSTTHSFPPLQCALAVLGADRIIFSVDYPYTERSRTSAARQRADRRRGSGEDRARQRGTATPPVKADALFLDGGTGHVVMNSPFRTVDATCWRRTCWVWALVRAVPQELMSSLWAGATA
jgi:hypothetical protein